MQALKSICDGTHPRTVLINGESRLQLLRWSKHYYEPARDDLISLIPAGVRKLLSFGCGWGALEGAMVNRGIEVTAVPIDSVISSCTEARGVAQVLYGDLNTSIENLGQRQFDCILLTSFLHLVDKPAPLIAALAKHLAPEGRMVISIPNLVQLPIRWRKFAGRKEYSDLGNYERSGVHQTSLRVVRNWIEGSEMKIEKIVPVFPDRTKSIPVIFKRIGRSLLASELLILLRKP